MAEPGPQVQDVSAPNPPPPPAEPAALQTPQQPGQQIVHLNWSHFKQEFSGKAEEDAEAHLLCTNDWMNAHHFVEGGEVQRFCLTLFRRSQIMVSFIRTYKYRLARVTKFI